MGNPEISFALTSTVEPPKKFTLDGDVFELLGVNHLSPDAEAEAMALFARHTILAEEVDGTKNLSRGEEVAKQLRATRLRIIHKLTTIPDTRTIPLHVQVKLLEAVREEMALSDDDGPTAVPADTVE
jgi:hypothetical protein